MSEAKREAKRKCIIACFEKIEADNNAYFQKWVEEYRAAFRQALDPRPEAERMTKS